MAIELSNRGRIVVYGGGGLLVLALVAGLADLVSNRRSAAITPKAAPTQSAAVKAAIPAPVPVAKKAVTPPKVAISKKPKGWEARARQRCELLKLAVQHSTQLSATNGDLTQRDYSEYLRVETAKICE